MMAFSVQLKPGIVRLIIGIGFVNLATLAWAINIALGRWLREDIGPLALAAGRFLVAFLLFAVISLRLLQPQERRLGKDRWLLFGMALSGVVLFSPVLYLGLRFTTASNASLIMGLGPLMTGMLAALLIKEPMSRRQLVGSILSLFGILVLLWGFSFSAWRQVHGSVGDLLIIGAVALWGLYTVLSREVTKTRSALSTSAFSVFLGLPFLIVAAGYEVQIIPVLAQAKLILSVLFLGIGSTVVAFFCWNSGVSRLGPTGAMLFFNTMPLYGLLINSLFLNERIMLPHFLGGALIIGGGLMGGKGRC